MKKNLLGGLMVLLLLTLNISCDKKTDVEAPLSPLASNGRATYLSNCIACHNPDPRQAGSVGPDIAFSSLELIEARVTKAQYPTGYKPKRESHMMPPFPQLAKEVPAIHAYLNSFKRN